MYGDKHRDRVDHPASRLIHARFTTAIIMIKCTDVPIPSAIHYTPAPYFFLTFCVSARSMATVTAGRSMSMLILDVELGDAVSDSGGTP